MKKAMRSRNIRASVIAAVVGGTVVLAGASEATGDTITLRTAYPGPSTSPIAECLFEWMAQELETRSEGRIEVETFSGGNTFADQTQQYDQLVAGVLDYTYVALQNHPGRFPLTSLITLPFSVSDRMAASRTLLEMSETDLADEFDDIRILAIFTGPMSDVHAREPIASFEDLGGLRVRAIGREVEQSARALGMDPVSIPLSALYENLQRGVIDGGLLTGAAIAVFRLHEVTDHHFLSNMIASPTIIGMNKDAYDRLPEDLQAIVDEHFSGWALAEYATQCFIDLDQLGIRLAEEAGNVVTVATDAQISVAREVLAPTVNEILEEMEADGLPAHATYQTLLDGMARHGEGDGTNR